MAWARRNLLLLKGRLGKPSVLVVRVFDCCGLERAQVDTPRPFLHRDGDDSTASWHLEDIVPMVRHCHELGQGWVPEDGVVWQTDVGDVEVDELGAVVVAFSEGDWEADLTYQGGGAVVTLKKGLVG